MKNNIKKAREAAGYSQKQVAITLKVSAPTVSDWESGKICPSAANIKKLSELYNVSSDYLLGLTDEPIFIRSCEHGESPERKIHTLHPVSILTAQYRISSDVLSSIIGCDPDRAGELILGTKTPTDEEYQIIAEFFNIDRNELQAGMLPLFPDSSIQHRIDLAKGRRFAAYGVERDFTQEELATIDSFIAFIRNQRNTSGD